MASEADRDPMHQTQRYFKWAGLIPALQNLPAAHVSSSAKDWRNPLRRPLINGVAKAAREVTGKGSRVGPVEHHRTGRPPTAGERRTLPDINWWEPIPRCARSSAQLAGH